MAATATRGRGGPPGGPQRVPSGQQSQPNSQSGQKRTNARGWASVAGAAPSPTPSPSLAAEQANGVPGPSSPQPSTRPGPLEEGQVRAMHDRMLFLILNLVGTRVVATVKAGIRYEGILSSASTDGEINVALKFARNLDEPATAAPIKRLLIILGKDLVDVHAADVDLEQRIAASTSAPVAADTFRTDAEISGAMGARDGRQLQSWADDTDDLSMGLDDAGMSGRGKGWDQFAVHERMFGSTTNYHEDLYTTKLDRSGADYKERERKANRLAQEILGGTASNPHILEERNVASQSQLDEEARYGAVQRGPNAYVPPGARAAQQVRKPNGDAAPPPSGPSVPAAAQNSAPAESAAVPPPFVRQPSQILAAQAAAGPSGTQTPPNNAESGAPNQLMPDFVKFVRNEKERMTTKRQAQLKKEKESKLSELLQFSQSFKLKAPIPADLVPVLAKDPDKQRQIQERAIASAASQTTSVAATAKITTSASSANVTPKAPAPTLPGAGIKPPRMSGDGKSTTITRDSIAAIPPYNPNKAKSPPQAQAGGSTLAPRMTPGSSGTSSVTPATAAALASTSATKLKPTAMSFVPGMTNSATSSPSRRPADLPPPPPAVPANPFFGQKQVKKGNSSMHVKEDFTPFKLSATVPPAASVPDTWGYQGRSTKDLVASALAAAPQPRPDAEPSTPAPIQTPSATPIPQVHAMPQQGMPQAAYPVFRGFQPPQFSYPPGAYAVGPNGVPYPTQQYVAQMQYSQAAHAAPPQVYSPQMAPQAGYVPGMPVYQPGRPPMFAAPPMYLAGGPMPNGATVMQGMPQPQPMQQPQPNQGGKSPHQPYRRLSSTSSVGGGGDGRQGGPQLQMTSMPPGMYGGGMPPNMQQQ